MGKPVWLTDERESWLGDATRWITERIGTLGLGPRADITSVKERLWGATLRVETSDRVLFFKAEGPGARHEPVIVADIAAAHPHLVPDLLAVDLERSWLLMADCGTSMWDSVDVAEEIDIWEQIFPTYARMQRATSKSVEGWIDVGTPDRRLSALTSLLERLLVGGHVPLEPDQRRAIDALLPDLARTCEDLSAFPFAQAIDHSDMHGGNVLVGRGEPRLVDWGDACITHPFTSPFVTYQHAVAKLPASDRPAATLRLRDAYLEVWNEDASADELRDAFAKAIWLGHIIRALNFAHQLGDPSEWANPVATFLRRWQEQHALLGRGDELILAVANEVE